MITAHRQATTPQAETDDGHGRGLATITPLASATGTEIEPADTTTWTARALHEGIDRAAQHPGPQLEAEAGA